MVVLRTAPSAVRSLLARHGLADARAVCVARLDCEVWRVTPAHSTGEFALRIYSLRSEDRAAIDSELAWLQSLAAEGLNVPRPVADRSGQVLMRETAETGGGEGQCGRWAVLLAWVPGRTVYAGLRPVHLRRTGGLIARLHANAARLVEQGEVTSRRLSGVKLVDWAGGRVAPSVICPPALQRLAARAAIVLHRRTATWPRDPAHWGFLHGDLHPWNLLHHQGQVGAIDFSDAGWGWHAQDLAAALQWLQRDLYGWTDLSGRYPALRAALLDGYTALRTLPPDTEAWLDTLILLRDYGTLQWMIDDWPCAEHRTWGPSFLRDFGRSLQVLLDAH